MGKTPRKLRTKLVILIAVAVLLVPAIYERYEYKLEPIFSDVPPPPDEFVSDIPPLAPIVEPNSREYFDSLYRPSDDQVVTDSLPTIDELDSELPRAWTVSVAGFEDFDEAFSMEMLLRDGDLQAYVLPNPTQPGPYVVYVGPYLNFERAEEVRTIIDARWGMASQITRFKP